VVRIRQTKTPLEVISFVKNILEKNILLWIPIFLDKISTKKGKFCKRVVNIFTIAYNMKGAQKNLISYFKYCQFWLNDLMDGI